MTHSWIERLVRRYRKRTRSQRQHARRRLLLEGLETRRLLAGDMMSMMDTHAAHSDVAEMGDHACAAHPDDAAKATEHCAALSLATPESATHRMTTSGNWSDPTIWQHGALPTNGAHVYVPADMTLTIDGVIAETMQTVRIDGTLRFDPTVDTQLRVDTLIGAPGSSFEMGTSDLPINASVTARVVVADTGEIDRGDDPFALGRGLVLHGSSRIHGAEKTSWTVIDGARTGDATITLAQAPSGWNVGDTLVIAGTKMDATGDEVVSIAAIDGRSVTLSEPLAHDHITPRSDLRVHVANTTRNASIESENPELARRGHLMFMHSRDVQIAYGGFYDLGRTNKLEIVDDVVVDANGVLEEGTGTNVRGRYSVHFHRNGVKADSAPATVIGSAVVGSPGWGYVNHSSYVDMTNNVSYDVNGAAFNTEAGDEIGSFINNLSIKTHGTAESPVDRQGVQDFGHAGDGFWFQGPGVTIEGNVAAGATGSGLIVYADGLIQDGIGKTSFPAENLLDPALANGAATVPVVLAPLKSFRNNTAYGSAEGVRMYYHRTPVQLEPNEGEQQDQYQWQFPDSVVEGVTAWNNNTGVRLNYTLDTIFRDMTIVNSEGQVGEIGFDVTNVYNRGRHTYENFTVEGFATGVIPSPNGDVKIDGGSFNNGVDFLVLEPRQTHRRMEFSGDIQFGDLPGVLVDAEFVQRQNIVMQADSRVVVDSFANWFLLNDRVILNFGAHGGKQLFFAEQAAGHVLFAEQPEQATPDDPGPEVEEQFIGLTNAELLAQSGSSFGGNLLPSDAIDAPGDGIVGMIGTATPDSGLLPDPEEDEDFDEEDEPDGEDVGNEEEPEDEEADEEPEEEEADESDGEACDEDDPDHEPDDEPDEEESGEEGAESETGEPDEAEGDEPDENFDEHEEGDEESDADEQDEPNPDVGPDDEFGDDEEADESVDEEQDEGEDTDELEEEESDAPDDGIDEHEEVDEESDTDEPDTELEQEDEVGDDFGDDVELDEGMDEEQGEGEDTEVADEVDEENEGDGEFTSLLHNISLPTDVNADTLTTAIDALMIINQLNLGEEALAALHQSTIVAFVDVNGDGSLSPMDALLVINILNPNAITAEGEAEPEKPDSQVLPPVGQSVAPAPITSQASRSATKTPKVTLRAVTNAFRSAMERSIQAIEQAVEDEELHRSVDFESLLEELAREL